MNRDIKLLDCTLRDGGLGLQDDAVNTKTGRAFSREDAEALSELLCRSGADIVELGCVEDISGLEGYSIYSSMEEISAFMQRENEEQIMAAFLRGPDISLDKIPDYREGLCDAIRFCVRYSEQKKSIDYCAALSKKGYKVFIQPMLTMRYTQDELESMISRANEMHAYALYIVDSYGYMTESDIGELFRLYDEQLDPDIYIGFHAHNNMNLAFSNVQSFIKTAGCRKIIVDTCITGMGQGAGNLQTELAAPYLNQLDGSGKNYDMKYLFDACEIVEKYNNVPYWGYSVDKLIPALHKMAYKYSKAFRHQYGLKYSVIDDVLSNPDIPYDMKQRYTPENAKKLLLLSGLDVGE